MNSFQLKTIKVRDNFSKVQNAMVSDLEQALYMEAEAIMTASKRYYVPVVSGSLRNSGTVSKPHRTADSVEITLGFGGASAPYAAIVHEYPKSYGQGKNKYLSQPLGIAAKGMAGRIAKYIKRRAKERS